MSMRRTRPLSIEGSREVIEEMSRPPADTPERRATLQRAKEMRPAVDRVLHRMLTGYDRCADNPDKD